MDQKEMENLQNHYKTLIERFGLYAMGIMILFLPYSIYNITGYSSPFFLAIEFVLSIIGFVFLLVGSRRGEYGNRDPKKILFFAFISLFIISFITFFVGMATNFPITDELAIDMLSVKSVMEGHNPYGMIFSLKSLEMMGVPNTYLTPTTLGNYVTSLQYPALSFLLMAPFVVFHIKPEVLLLLFSVFLISIVPFSFIKNKMDYAAPLATAIAIFNINFILFSFNGITDVIWATFVGMAILLIDKKTLSPVFYGLALSTKQVPLIIFPFLVIYIWKTFGFKRALEYAGISIAIFLIFNLPFIILNPGAYISSVVGPEFSPLLGIGFGISQISFMGILPYARSNFFAALMISTWLISLIYYYLSFERNKYTLTVFPIIIFLFNYRLLENYIIYWPVISLIFIPPLFKEKNISVRKINVSEKISEIRRLKLFLKNRKNLAITIVVILLLLSPFMVLLNDDVNYHQQLIIEDVKPVSFNKSFVTAIDVSIYYSGPENNVPLFFRILESGILYSPNGFIWNTTGDPSISHDQVKTFELSTNQPEEYLNMGNSYILEAYDGNLLGWLNIVWKQNSQS